MDLAAELAERIVAAKGAAPLVVGLTGPQGSGKSTLAAGLVGALTARGWRATILALDDLYLPRAERARLARAVHPLFATRGPPGTHDAALGSTILAALAGGGDALTPLFDKGADDRADEPRRIGPADVVLFEGWCVGARPQDPAALAAPVNALERDEDAQGVWRGAVNAALAGPYRALFERVGFQVLLRPPGFEAVFGWRRQQELALRAEGRGQSDADLARFIQHYERLTRHIDTEMPSRADVVVELGAAREVAGLWARS